MKRRTVMRMAGALATGIARPRGRAIAQSAPQPMRDVIVLLPDVTGSVLGKDGRDGGVLSGSAFFDALESIGRNFSALRLDGDDESLDDLGDGIVPNELSESRPLLVGSRSNLKRVSPKLL